jgi:hypothetical protein
VTDAGPAAGAIDPHRPALVAAAALIGAALQRANGFYEPTALVFVLIALALTWAALLAPRGLDRLVADRPSVVALLLAVVLLGQLLVIARSPIGMYFAQPMPAQHAGFLPGLVVAGLAGLAPLIATPRARPAAAALLLAAAATLGVLTYRGSPTPAIDVVTVHHEAFAALARGTSPYSITFPDIYSGREAFYPPGTVAEGRVQFGFTYPPLSLLMAWPGHLLGDFRYAELAGLLTGAGALIAAGRASAVAVLAAGVLLFTPRGFFALEQAWTEPLAIAWLGLAAWAARAARPLLAAAALGFAGATKQYLVVAIPLAGRLAADRGAAWRAVLASAAAAAAACAPGLLDARNAFASVVMVQLREALRMDALSVAVWLAHSGWPLPGWGYLLLVGGALIVAGWRAPATPAGVFGALAATLLTMFAFGKKAFCNYYVLVLAVLVIAIALPRRRDAAAGASNAA